MKAIILSSIFISLMIGAPIAAIIPTVMAQETSHDYYFGWRDAYNNWVNFGKRATDMDPQSALYWKGFDAGLKYAKEHVKVIVENGHIFVDIKAAAYMTGWIDGQATHANGLPNTLKLSMFKEYDDGFDAGYDAPHDTLHANATG